MRRMFRKVISIAMSVMLAASMAGCSKGADDASASGTTGGTKEYVPLETESESLASDTKFKDTLNIAVSQESATYDLPMTTSAVARQMLAGTVWERLVTLNANAEPVPELCTSWDMSDDARTFTFYLRKGVLFHDGTEMKAEDVAASLNRWIESYSQATALVGSGRFTEVDDYTVTITTDSAALTLVDMLAGATQVAIITTKECCEDLDDNGYMKSFVGTGPYTFVEWVQGQYILLSRFEDYVPYYVEGTTDEIMDGWAGYKHAYTKNLKFWYVAESSTVVAGLQTGQYDVAGVASENIATVKSAGLSVASEQGGISCLVFNKSEESIANNIYIRKAVNAAINCDDVLMAAFGEFYDLGSCYMDDTNAFWLTDAGVEEYNQKDADKAKQYLEEAGYNGETFTILAPTLSHYDNIALVMEQELEAIGMNVEVSICDWATFTQLRTDKTGYDLYVTSFATVPIPTLKSFFGASYPGWTDDEHLTELLAKFNSATTKEDALAAWVEIQGYCWDYLPCIVPGHYGSAVAYNPDVQGLYLGNGMYYWNAYIKEK